MAGIANPPTEPALSIEVRGHQWWWEFAYLNDDPSKTFVTANEIHIPVGKPVRFALKGEDVIHTFWVPSLGGKIQLIPGQTNLTWLEADKPGVYRGQCSQYCGQQHAHMVLTVFADPSDAFEAWREAQLRAASQPNSRRHAPRRAALHRALRGLPHRARHACQRPCRARSDPPHVAHDHRRRRAAQQSRLSCPAGSPIRKASSPVRSCPIRNYPGLISQASDRFSLR